LLWALKSEINDTQSFIHKKLEWCLKGTGQVTFTTSRYFKRMIKIFADDER